MSNYRLHARKYAAALAVVCAMSLSLVAAPRAEALKNIRIGNFGVINDNYFRGAQPESGDYADLAKLGVKTVIDLTRDGRDDERKLVERSGMSFYRIPLTTSEAPSTAAVNQFLKIVNDPANQPVFVHCQGGRHRTGVMTAVYRMTQNSWTPDRAYAEMKKFRFEGFPGHPELKKFVYSYYTQFDRNNRLAKDAKDGELAGAGATK
jgi:protein tyrosine/serine phosphatase